MKKVIVGAISFSLVTTPIYSSQENRNSFKDELVLYQEFSQKYKEEIEQHFEDYILPERTFEALSPSYSKIMKYADKIPLLGKGVRKAFSVGLDVAYDVSEIVTGEKIESISEIGKENVDNITKMYLSHTFSMLNVAARKEKDKLNRYLEIEDAEKRTKKIKNLLSDLGAFSEVAPKNTDERAVFNSRAIISLIRVTGALHHEVNDNRNAINTIKNQYKELKKNLNKNNKEFLKYKEIETKQEENSIELINTLTKSVEASKALIVNPQKDYSSLNKHVNNVKDKLETASKLANQAVAIAASFGVSPSAMKYLNRSASAIGVGLNVVSAIGTPPNPLAIGNALVSISSLFGGGAPDPDAERHAEIMAAFNQVFENQKTMINNQEKIIKLQKVTIEMIETLAINQENRHDEVTQKIDTLLSITSHTHRMIKDFSNLNLFKNSCNALREDLNALIHNYKGPEDKINKYVRNALDDFNGSINRNFIGCSDYFMILRNRNHSYFMAKSYSTADSDKSNIEEYILHGYMPVLESFKYLAGSTRDMAFMSVFPNMDIDSGFNSFDMTYHASNRKLMLEDHIEDLQYVYQSSALKEYVEYLSFYMDLSRRVYVNKNDKYYGLYRRLKNEIGRVKEMVNIGLAQQSILAGNSTLRYYVRNLERKYNLKELIKVLNYNPVFQKNFFTYYLRSMIYDQNISVKQFFENTKEGHRINLSGDHFYIDKGLLVIEVGKGNYTKFYLPSEEDLTNSSVLLPKTYDDLLELKALIHLMELRSTNAVKINI